MDLDSENSDESEQETDRKGYIREVEKVDGYSRYFMFCVVFVVSCSL